jgi:hypothetical protein
MNRIALFLAVLALSLGAVAQAPNPNPAANVATNNGQFTISAKVVPLFSKTGTVPATDVGGTFAVTTNLSLRSDNIVAANQQGYFGGVQYFLPSSKILAKTNFDPSTFQFGLAASAGAVNNGVNQRFGYLAHGLVNFDPTHSGKFTVTLIDAGVISGNIVNAGGVKPWLSVGMNLGF